MEVAIQGKESQDKDNNETPLRESYMPKQPFCVRYLTKEEKAKFNKIDLEREIPISTKSFKELELTENIKTVVPKIRATMFRNIKQEQATHGVYQLKFVAINGNEFSIPYTIKREEERISPAILKEDLPLLKEYIKSILETQNKNFSQLISKKLLMDKFRLITSDAESFLIWFKNLEPNENNIIEIETKKNNKIELEIQYVMYGKNKTVQIRKEDKIKFAKFIDYFMKNKTTTYVNKDEVPLIDSTLGKVFKGKYKQTFGAFHLFLDEVMQKSSASGSETLQFTSKDGEIITLDIFRKYIGNSYGSAYCINNKDINALEKILSSIKDYLKLWAEETRKAFKDETEKLSSEDSLDLFYFIDRQIGDITIQKINEENSPLKIEHFFREYREPIILDNILVNNEIFTISTLTDDLIKEQRVLIDGRKLLHFTDRPSAISVLLSNEIAIGTHDGTLNIYKRSNDIIPKLDPRRELKLSFSKRIHNGLIISINSIKEHFAVITDKEINIYDKNDLIEGRMPIQTISRNKKIISDACFLRNSTFAKMVVLYSDDTIEIMRKKDENEISPTLKHHFTKLVGATDGNFLAISKNGRIYKFIITKDSFYKKKLLDTKLEVSCISELKDTKNFPKKDEFFIIDENMKLKKYHLDNKNDTLSLKYSLSLAPYIDIEENEKPMQIISHNENVYIILAGITRCRILKLERK
ncbi:MAG: hypothetical protein ACOX3T_06440 [Bdellovibrionota bacterium]